MIDFSKYMPRADAARPLSLLETYQQLDRRTSHAGEPRLHQRRAMEALQERASCSSSVLRLGTGSGKTVIGLTFLHQKQKESNLPVVYLCPTVQLVNQVIEEAAKVGLGAVAYGRNERHPDAAAVAGEKILVCTYAKLFNGKNTFNHEDVRLRPFAMVLDDAHVGAQEARKCFCVRIEGDLYQKVRSVLLGACRSFSASEAERISDGDPSTVMDVPYWSWRDLAGEVRGILEGSEGGHHFEWRNIRDHLDLCRCVISGRTVEFFTDAPLVGTNAAYTAVTHRLFMSATLPDEGVLVRDLRCDAEAALNPVQPDRGLGIGERMVIAPSLVDPSLTEDWVIQAASALSRQVRVVALCSTGAQLEKWRTAGAQADLGNDAADAVQGLQNGTVHFAAFAQRYDGIDLPDDACRVLVIDGIPRGQSLGDAVDAATEGYPGGRFTRWAFRVEQGLGRGVRSESDYCVVLLSGHDLASFVGKHEVREGFSPGTRRQLELTRELAKIAKLEGKAPHEAVWELVQSALSRNGSWRDFYRSNMSNHEELPGVDELAVRVSGAVAEAFSLASERRLSEAVTVVSALLASDECKGLNDAASGWLLQLKAFLTFGLNRGEALKIQAAAHRRNGTLLAPPNVDLARSPKVSEQGASLLRWYQGFDDGGAAMAEFTSILSRLTFDVSAAVFEQAFKELAPLLGARGERPEKEFGRGPDNAVFWATEDWVVEAKTKKTNLVLSKGEGEQLLAAAEWYWATYPEQSRRMTPVFVANTASTERDAYFPKHSAVLTPQALGQIIQRVRGVLVQLCVRRPSQWTAGEVANLLVDAQLEPPRLRALLESI